MQWTRFRIVLGFLACLAPGGAWADPVEVMADGEAPSRDLAIAKALVEALQQVTGTAIASTQQMSAALAGAAGPDGAVTVLSEASQAEIIRQTNGVIRAYRVLGVSQEVGSQVIVHLSVTVEKYTPKGLGGDTRRRIAVAPFTDPAGRSSSAGKRFAERLTAYLVQTRRFAVVDRGNDEAYASEMSLLASGQTPAAERARIGQVIGADYVVVGHLQASTSQTTETLIPVTGEVARSTSVSAGRTDYAVIEIATRQVKFTGSIVGGGSDDAVAGRIGDEIGEAIYPMRIIDSSDPNELVINQGGTGMKPGQQFKAFELSQELFDPYTKESLGRREREVGRVEVVRVLSKLSYARLVQGKLPPSGADLVLRRFVEPSPPPRARAAAPAADPPLKLPFD